MKWRPIEIAPRDGSEILVFCPGLRCWERALSGEIVVAAWNERDWPMAGWYSDSCAYVYGYESTGDYVVHEAISPTHWMPLPQPPGDTVGEETE